jgi:hypothetical protein
MKVVRVSTGFPHSLLPMNPKRHNRVGGRVSPPASHTTVHAGRRTAVPGSPYGMTQHSFSATRVAAGSSANRLRPFRNKTVEGRVCPPSSALPEL